MKKIECIIMDWAGTAVDYGCFAPVAAFIEAFAENGLVIDVVQTRKPMGLPKIQHIRELLSIIIHSIFFILALYNLLIQFSFCSTRLLLRAGKCRSGKRLFTVP